MSEASSSSGAYAGSIQLQRLASGTFSRTFSADAAVPLPGLAAAATAAAYCPSVVPGGDLQTPPAEDGGAITLCAATAAAAATAAPPLQSGQEATLAGALQQLPQIQTRAGQGTSQESCCNAWVSLNINICSSSC